MECTPGSDGGRWPTVESVCGRHGSCVPAAGGGFYCSCDADWSSSGDFLASPYAACHVNQRAILWMWVGSFAATLVCVLLCARVVRHYMAILRAQNQRKESTRISKVSQRPGGGGPAGGGATVKPRGFRSSRCRFLSRAWAGFYSGFVFVFHNHTRRSLVGASFMLLIYIVLCSLKISTLATHQADHDTELSGHGRTGTLIGYDVFPTLLYCASSLVFMITGHWSSLIWCASAQAFYSKAEGAKLEAKTKRELAVASLFGIACYILPWIGLALARADADAHDADPGPAYELVLALHFQLKGLVPVTMSITDQRIARRVINNLKRHQETQERLANKQHEQQLAMISAHRPMVVVAPKTTAAAAGAHSGLASPSGLGNAAPNTHATGAGTVHAHGATLGAGAAGGGGNAAKEKKIVSRLSRPTGEEDDTVLVSVSRPGSQQQGEEALLLLQRTHTQTQTQTHERLKSPMSSSALSQGGVSVAFAGGGGGNGGNGGDASGRSRMASAQRDRERERRTASLDTLPSHRVLMRQTSVELAPIPSHRSGSDSVDGDVDGGRGRERMLVEFSPSASPNLGPSHPSTAGLMAGHGGDVTAAWGVPAAGARSSSDDADDAPADTDANASLSHLPHPNPRYAPSPPPANAKSEAASADFDAHQQQQQQQQLPGTVSGSPRVSTPARRATDPASQRTSTVVVRISDGEATGGSAAATNANAHGGAHGRSGESGSVRQLQLRVHVPLSESSAFLSAARLSHLASSVSPVAEPVGTPLASDLPSGGSGTAASASASAQQSRRLGARPSHSSAALMASTTSSVHLMPHRASQMHSSTQNHSSNPSRRSTSPTPFQPQRAGGGGPTAHHHSLAVPGSGTSGHSVSWGSSASSQAQTQAQQQQAAAPARTSQAELQAENRSKIADFTASLAKHNRSARATSLVWLAANSCFAWMPLLRSFVPFVMPVHIIFTLIALRTFLTTLMPRSTAVAAPASQRPDAGGSTGGGGGAGGRHSVNPSATRTLVTAANEIHTRAEPDSKV